MLAESKVRKLTPDEYLELEEKAEFKSEYWDGVMIPLHGNSPELSGVTENHAQIVTNLVATLLPEAKRRNCRVLATDLKVWVDKHRRFFYPDILIVCGASVYYKEKRTAICNPKILIEVLSKSTESNDRGDKFEAYRTLDSLEEYILIAQSKPVVEQFVKQTDGSWKLWATIGLESTITLFSFDLAVKLTEIYDLVEFRSEEI